MPLKYGILVSQRKEPTTIEYAGEDVERVHSMALFAGPLVWGKPFTIQFTGTNVKYSEDGSTYSTTLSKEIHSGDTFSISAMAYQAGIRLNCWKGEFVTSLMKAISNYPINEPTETAQNLR